MCLSPKTSCHNITISNFNTNRTEDLKHSFRCQFRLALTSCYPLSCRWRGSEVSGMAIVETGVLTGYVAANVNELKSQSGAVKRVDSSESKIVLYLDEVGISVAFNVCCVSE